MLTSILIKHTVKLNKLNHQLEHIVSYDALRTCDLTHLIPSDLLMSTAYFPSKSLDILTSTANNELTQLVDWLC